MDDMQKINEQLKILSDNKDCIEWVLGQQAELRSELLAFFKKDIKEIDSAISNLSLGENSGEFSAKILTIVRDLYIQYWRQSFQLVSPEQLITIDGSQGSSSITDSEGSSSITDSEGSSSITDSEPKPGK
jgi:hypothetical protein